MWTHILLWLILTAPLFKKLLPWIILAALAYFVLGFVHPTAAVVVGLAVFAFGFRKARAADNRERAHGRELQKAWERRRETDGIVIDDGETIRIGNQDDIEALPDDLEATFYMSEKQLRIMEARERREREAKKAGGGRKRPSM